MMVLITYDVETTTREGRKRLRQVAKTCVDYGQRVQNSVFECVLEPAQLTKLRHILIGIICEKRDSLRFYHLGKKWAGKVEHVGAKTSVNPETDQLII
jgi:CRISPR-associated protein Cas2